LVSISSRHRHNHDLGHIGLNAICTLAAGGLGLAKLARGFLRDHRQGDRRPAWRSPLIRASEILVMFATSSTSRGATLRSTAATAR
jgi:hypothetical protein